jgi:hypothetical protein
MKGVEKAINDHVAASFGNNLDKIENVIIIIYRIRNIGNTSQL